MSLSCILNWWMLSWQTTAAEIAQLGERVTEDHKVPGSIPGFGTEHPAACPFLNVIFFIISTKYLIKKDIHQINQSEKNNTIMIQRVPNNIVFKKLR